MRSPRSLRSLAMRKLGGVILVGGLGTRLRPLTLHQPKALLPILNRPFLSYQFASLKAAGVSVVCLAASPWFRRWKREITSMAPRGLRLVWAFEKKPLGTGGAIRFGFDHLIHAIRDIETVAVFNGDVLIEADISRVNRFHHAAKADCTIALSRVLDSSRFGLVKAGSGGHIESFLEKPKGKPRPGWINAGLYVMSRSFLESIPAGAVLSVEREVFPARLKQGWRLFAHRIHGYWNDIGTPPTYLAAHKDLMASKRNWTGIGNLSKGSSLSRGARLVQGKGSSVPKDAVLEGFVCLGEGVLLGPDSSVCDSVIMDGTQVGPRCVLRGVILGRHCRIGEGTILSEGTVLGEGTSLPPFTKS